MTDFYFPHELKKAKLEFKVAAGTEEAKASIKKGGEQGADWKTAELEVDEETASVSLDCLAEAKPEDSPFFFKGPELPDPPPPPPPAPHQNLSARGKLGINFGKDILKITGALNGGGGAAASAGGGAGYVAGASGGQGGAVTVGGKGYAINPVFEVGALLQSDESAILALRCILRYFYHWCDAINLSVDYFKNQLPKEQTEEDVLTGFLGWNWWMAVFSMFAMKDMMFDVASEEADFIAGILQKIGVEAKLDLNAGMNLDVEVGIEASGTVAGRIYLPLAVMLAPFIEFLMAGSSAPVPEGGGLADKIVPFVEGKVEDRICIHLGGMPAALQIEAKGTIATFTFAVPKGSPLRAKIEQVGKKVFKAADHYKNAKASALPDETRLLRLFIELLDAEVKNIVTMIRAASQKNAQAGTQAASAAFTTAVPFVKQIMDALQGKSADQPPGVGGEAKAAIDMLARTKIQGVSVGAGGPCESEDNGDRKKLTLHVSDAEKAKIEASGWSPKTPAEAELETTRLEVELPFTPQVVGWNFVAQNPDLGKDYAGIVAGFDFLEDRNRCMETCHSRGWVPDALGAYEDHHPDDGQGRHWAWVSVGLSDYLAGQTPPLAMPAIDLEGDKLRITFDQMPVGAVGGDVHGATPMLSGATITREKIWKVVLMDQATPEEAEDIQAEVGKNQPDSDPYAIPILDDLLDRAVGGA